jgi:hypothetical protein
MTPLEKQQAIKALFSSIQDSEFIKIVKDPDGSVLVGETASTFLVYMNCSYVRLGGQPLDLTLEFKKHE